MEFEQIPNKEGSRESVIGVQNHSILRQERPREASVLRQEDMTGRKLIERHDTDRGEEANVKPYGNDIIDHNEVDLEMDGLK